MEEIYYQVQNYGDTGRVQMTRETDDFAEALQFAKETPSGNVALLENGGNLSEYHFSPKHPPTAKVIREKFIREAKARGVILAWTE